MWGVRKERRSYTDKAWKRADLGPWDERWSRLPEAARRAFVAHLKGAPKGGVPAGRFSEEVLQELKASGLVEGQVVSTRGEKVFVAAGATGFTTRIRALDRYRLLRDASLGELHKYADYCFDSNGLHRALCEVLRQDFGADGGASGDPIGTFVVRSSWPGRAARSLKEPLADEVLSAVRAAGGKLTVEELEARLGNHSHEDVRQTVDRLINLLALVEDLDPETFRIQVGILPAVLADEQKRKRPPSELVPQAPAEVGPEAGIDVPDLRAVLLELSVQRAQLRTDGALFQKDWDRLAAGLEPLPDWAKAYDLDVTIRVEDSLDLADLLELTREVKGGSKGGFIEVSPAGRRWLALPPEEQYDALYRYRREPIADNYDPTDYFLGSEINSFRSRKTPDRLYERADPEPLRQSVYRCFQELPVGPFVALEAFLDRATHGERNPLWLGGDARGLVVRRGFRRVPALEEQVEELGRELLRDVVTRLTEMGAVQLGRAGDGTLLLARRPRLDFYFGGQPAPVEEAPVAPTRVVVQPDFTVMVIGLDPSPAGALVAFADRVQGRASVGSMTFRLSRESVIRGVSAGLTGDGIVSQLETLTGGALPQNVAIQVRTWAGQVRQVKVAPVVLITCPDAETAGRVRSALGKKTRVVSDTMLALDAKELTGAQRTKLREQGILVED